MMSCTGVMRRADEMEKVEWDCTTYCIPKLIPETSSPMQKNQFYIQTIATIRDGGGHPSTKMGALASCFAVGPSTLNTVKESFQSLYDYQSQEIMVTGSCFELINAQLHGDNGQMISFSDNCPGMD